MTPVEYRAELERLVAATGEAAAAVQSPTIVAGALPPAWRVDAGGRRFLVSTDPLRRDLRALGEKSDPENRTRVQTRLARLIADLDGYEAAPAGAAKERRLLSAILASREFAAVHGPTWFDRLKQRLADMLLRLVSLILGSSRFPMVASALVFGLVGLAVVVTAVWIYRTLAGGHVEMVVPDVAVSAKEWRVWLREAQEAAAAGQWRDAVRLAYWAGISYLESQGEWPPDRARTPREYLRLLPAASAHRPALTALTRTFEPVWYGYRDASATTFTHTTGELEKLGCR
jgi:Domain of unknown function (DUF4129)